MISFLRYYKVYFILSGVLILGSIACLAVFGLSLGIDFTGGSILEVEYLQERPDNQFIREQLDGLDLGTLYVQPTGEKGIIFRFKDIDEEFHQEILQKLGDVEERRFESIGPVIGKELKKKTQVAIGLALVLIVIYITFSFRKVSRPVKSWQYSIAALVALFHDALIPLGVLAFLGRFYGVEITIPIVTAILTILGYSINDTVVVFDRLRENLLKGDSVTFAETVDRSLNQTLARSVNTSFTTLLVLLAIFFFGGVTLEYFSLTLIIGVIVGTYSSIFVASPLLVRWLEWKNRKRIS